MHVVADDSTEGRTCRPEAAKLSIIYAVSAGEDSSPSDKPPYNSKFYLFLDVLKIVKSRSVIYYLLAYACDTVHVYFKIRSNT